MFINLFDCGQHTAMIPGTLCGRVCFFVNTLCFSSCQIDSQPQFAVDNFEFLRYCAFVRRLVSFCSAGVCIVFYIFPFIDDTVFQCVLLKACIWYFAFLPAWSSADVCVCTDVRM